MNLKEKKVKDTLTDIVLDILSDRMAMTKTLSSPSTKALLDLQHTQTHRKRNLDNRLKQFSIVR